MGGVKKTAVTVDTTRDGPRAGAPPRTLRKRLPREQTPDGPRFSLSRERQLSIQLGPNFEITARGERPGVISETQLN